MEKKPSTEKRKVGRFNSLALKLTVSLAIFAVLFSIFTGVINNWREEKLLFEKEQEGQIEIIGNIIKVSIKDMMAGKLYSSVSDSVSKILQERFEIYDCIIYNEEKKIIFDSTYEREGKQYSKNILHKNTKYLFFEMKEGKSDYGAIILGYRPMAILQEQRAKKMIYFGKSIANGIAGYIAAYNFDQIQFFVERLIKNSRDVEYCIVMRPSGKVLYHSKSRASEGKALEDKLNKNALKVNIRQPIIIQEIKGKTFYDKLIDISTVVEQGGSPMGVVRLGYSLKSLYVKDLMSKLTISVFWAALAVVCFAIAYFMSIRIAKPIIVIADMAKKVGEGFLDEKVEVKTKINEIELLADSFNEMVKGLKERDLVKDTFSRYVTKQVAEEILKDPEKIALGGRKQEVTILFSDIRGFTTFSEGHSPEEVISHLNEYLSAMVDVIFKYEGTLDKFVGDAIMAVFGSPLPHEDDPLRAVKTAIEMQIRLNDLNEKWIKEGKEPLKIGIGVNTGDVIVGNIGDIRRMEYTVIGDNVNLASRIEGLTKNYNCPIIISGNTYEKVKDSVEVKKLETVTVKGKAHSVEIYELLGLKV